MLKLAATLVAGLGGIVALTVAYRRQREQEARRDSTRFDAAAEQLGSDDGAIRLAGVYAVTALADESASLRPAVVQLMCAYLRLNRANDGPVQQTILETMAKRTKATHGTGSWSNYDFDLHGVVVGDRLSWNGCRFDGSVNFEGAIFKHETQFVLTQFGGPLNLNDAHFERECHLFFGAFAGVVLMNNVAFERSVNAIQTTFSGGLQANSVEFKNGASFSKSRFSNGAIFAGSTFAYASFDDCVFSRGDAGQQTDAVHNGDAHFRDARFVGRADFNGATFVAQALFESVDFGEEPTFKGTRFMDGGSIDGASFPGETPAAFGMLSPPRNASTPEARS